MTELTNITNEQIIAGYKRLNGVNDTANMISGAFKNGTFNNLKVEFEYIQHDDEDEELTQSQYNTRIANGEDPDYFTTYARVSWGDSSDISGNEIPSDSVRIAL